MKEKDNKSFNIVRNVLSIFVLIIFFIIELLYIKVIPDNSLNNIIDNIPNEILSVSKAQENNQVIDNNVIQVSDSNIISTISEVEDNANNIVFNGNYKFATVSEAYFDNALFIGDSRMLGFSIYKKLEGATYYCYQSADAFTILDKEYELEPYGMISLYTLLSVKRFDKIYISLGINNVAAGIENHKKHFKRLIDTVLTVQPSAIIYLLANLHVTAEIINDSPYLTNENINLINGFISEFADNRRIFYLDPNICYDDEFGNMDSELSYDHAHIYVKHYDRYLYFLLSHAVVYE